MVEPPFKAVLFMTISPEGDAVKSSMKTTGNMADIGLGLLMSMARDAEFEIIVRSAVEMLDSDRGKGLIKDLRKV